MHTIYNKGSLLAIEHSEAIVNVIIKVFEELSFFYDYVMHYLKDCQWVSPEVSIVLRYFISLPILIRKISPPHPLSPLLLIYSNRARSELLLVEVLQAHISTNDQSIIFCTMRWSYERMTTLENNTILIIKIES